MDFDTLKYNGKVLWTAVSLAVVGTWLVSNEYHSTKHELELLKIKQHNDQEKDQALINQRVDFIMREMEDVNGRIDRKTKNATEFFKRELQRLDNDSQSQWDFMNKNHSD